MRKPAFCKCENKVEDQLPSTGAADQRLSYHYIDSTIPLLPESVISHYENMSMQYEAIFHGCKNDNFQLKFFTIFIFLLKTYIVGTR